MAAVQAVFGGCHCWEGLASQLGFQARPPSVVGPVKASALDAVSGLGPGGSDAVSRVSTAASLTDLAGSSVTLQPPPMLLAQCFSVVDIVQLLGWSSPVDLAALRATSSAFADSEGLLGEAALQRLARFFLGLWPKTVGISIHEAAEAGDAEAVWAHMYLGASANDYDVHGCVPLHYVADRKHVGVFKILTRAGADLQARHTGRNIRFGWTALHFAAHAGARDIVLLLLLQGAEVNRMDGCRRTPLFYAQSRNRDACSRILAKFGGSADSHIVESNNLREAQRLDEDNVLIAQGRATEQWDASGADGNDVHAEGAVQTATDREAETAVLQPYLGPAGDVGPSLTMAAALMPGFEW